MELESFHHIFDKKKSNIKFHKNSFSGSRVAPCEGTDGRTGATKLIVALSNFAKATKKGRCREYCNDLSSYV